MKNAIILPVLAMLFILITNSTYSRQNNTPVVVINTDIAVEGLSITNIADSKCGKDSVFISFAIKNKMNTAGVKARFTILVNGIDETAAFELNSSFCNIFSRTQSISIHAKAAIKQSWTVPLSPTISVSAEACNIEGVPVQFHEINPANNKQEIRDPRLHNVVLPQSICECGFLNELIDTSARYIISGNIKLNSTGTLSAPAYSSVADNLAPVLSKEYATALKLKFAGFTGDGNTIPSYNIIFALNGLMLTERNLLNTNNSLTFANSENITEQKWTIKKNANGSYSFFCHSSLGSHCFILGRSAAEAASPQNPVLKPTLSPNTPDKYQEFDLIKLQQ